MKELWTEDQKQIQDEIELIVRDKAKVFCIRKSPRKISRVFPKGTTNTGAENLLVLHHPRDPSCSRPTCSFCYHLKDKPLRFFESTRTKQADIYLGLTFPERIFELQRRLFTRVTTPKESCATFSFQGKQRIYNATVEDISLKGAKIRCQTPFPIIKGNILKPFTLRVCKQLYSTDDTTLTIPEATVKWVSSLDSTTYLVGIHFSLPKGDDFILSEYIDYRLTEEKICSHHV